MALPRKLPQDVNVSNGARRLWDALRSYMGEKAICWPSQERLAADLYISERALRYRIADLEQAGLLIVRRVAGRGKSRNHYELFINPQMSLDLEPVENSVEISDGESEIYDSNRKSLPVACARIAGSYYESSTEPNTLVPERASSDEAVEIHSAAFQEPGNAESESSKSSLAREAETLRPAPLAACVRSPAGSDGEIPASLPSGAADRSPAPIRPLGISGSSPRVGHATGGEWDRDQWQPGQPDVHSPDAGGNRAKPGAPADLVECEDRGMRKRREQPASERLCIAGRVNPPLRTAAGASGIIGPGASRGFCEYERAAIDRTLAASPSLRKYASHPHLPAMLERTAARLHINGFTVASILARKGREIELYPSCWPRSPAWFPAAIERYIRGEPEYFLPAREKSHDRDTPRVLVPQTVPDLQLDRDVPPPGARSGPGGITRAGECSVLTAWAKERDAA